MKPSIIIALSLLACACAPKEQAAAPAQAPAQPPATAVLAAPPAPGAIEQASAQTKPELHRFVFEQRTETPGPSDAQIVGTEPTPCGTVLVTRVASIPLNDRRVAPDWVVELDAVGKTVRKWGVPYEALLVGLDGERVQFRTEAGTYWANAAGVVEQADTNGIDLGGERPASLVDGGKAFDCPALDGDSKNWSCADVRDATGQPRRLATENVCS